MLVQKLRLQRGWSQQQLATLSGLSVRTIQRIEKDGHVASPESLKSLASVFEIDFSTLHKAEPGMTTTQNDEHDVPSRSPEAAPPSRPSPARPADVGGLNAEEILALQHVRQRKAFYMHLLQYLVVVSTLLAINLWHNPHRLWVGWVAFGWGVGLLIHALRSFDLLPFFGPEWERREVEKYLGRPI